MERSTAQRRAIHKAFEEAGRPLGPNEIFDLARSDVPGLGIATVYRAIKSLLDDGVLTQVDLPGEPPRYEVSGKAHHHYFRCNVCHRVYDVFGCSDGYKTLAPKGFRLDAHELYLMGRCSNCVAA